MISASASAQSGASHAHSDYPRHGSDREDGARYRLAGVEGVGSSLLLIHADTMMSVNIAMVRESEVFPNEPEHCTLVPLLNTEVPEFREQLDGRLAELSRGHTDEIAPVAAGASART